MTLDHYITNLDRELHRPDLKADAAAWACEEPERPFDRDQTIDPLCPKCRLAGRAAVANGDDGFVVSPTSSDLYPLGPDLRLSVALDAVEAFLAEKGRL